MDALRKPNIFFALTSLTFYTMMIGCAIASNPGNYWGKLPVIIYLGILLSLIDIFRFRSDSVNFLFRMANLYVFFLCGVLTAFGLYAGFQATMLYHDFVVILH